MLLGCGYITKVQKLYQFEVHFFLKETLRTTINPRLRCGGLMVVLMTSSHLFHLKYYLKSVGLDHNISWKTHFVLSWLRWAQLSCEFYFTPWWKQECLLEYCKQISLMAEIQYGLISVKSYQNLIWYSTFSFLHFWSYSGFSVHSMGLLRSTVKWTIHLIVRLTFRLSSVRNNFAHLLFIQAIIWV